MISPSRQRVEIKKYFAFMRVVQCCRIYSIGTIREFRGAIMGETD